MKILIVSFESREQNLIKDLIKSLESHDHTVMLVNMLNYKNNAGKFDLSKDLIDSVHEFMPDRLYLSAHGIHDDVIYSYYKDFNQKKCLKSLSAREMAEIVALFYSPNSYPVLLPVELIMCFGGRSANYKLDHVRDSDKVNWMDSFAYRLFLHLTNLGIMTEMKSYLMAVEVTEGVVKCEDEEAIELRNQIDQLIIQANALWSMIDAYTEQQMDQTTETIQQDKTKTIQQDKLDDLYLQHTNKLMQIDAIKDQLTAGTRAGQGAICYAIHGGDNILQITMDNSDKLLYKGVFVNNEAAISNMAKKEEVITCILQ